VTPRRFLLALLLMASSAGPAAAALDPDAPDLARVLLLLVTLSTSLHVAPRPARNLLRPPLRLLGSSPWRWSPLALPIPFLLGGVPAGALLLLLLLPAGVRGARRSTSSRSLRAARDALAVAAVALVADGGGASLAGFAGTVFILALLLPEILAARAGAADPPLPPRPRGRMGVPRALPLLSTGVLAAFLFVALPRFTPRAAEEPAAAAHRERRARQDSGLPRGEGIASMPPREVRLGEIGVLQRDFRPRMEVTVLRGGRPADAEDLGALFRGGALEEFDGRAWRSVDRRVVLKDADDGVVDGIVALPRRRLPPTAESIEQRLRLLSSGTDTLYCLGMPVAVGGPGAAAGVAVHPRGEVRSVEPYAEGETFTIRSAAALGAYPLLEDEAFTRSRREALLAIPPGHGGTRELARAALGRAPPGRGTLRALEAFLAARCAYTLDLADPGGAPHVEAFLLSSRRGHCELFASSAAVMLRSVGIPARVAIGFRGGVFDPVAVKYTLRGADAHAWVEAWLEDEGWVTLDPTPPVAGAPREAAAAEEEQEAPGESGGGWLRSILRFDGAARDRLLGSVSRGVGAFVERGFLDADGSPRRSTLWTFLLSSALVAAALLLRRSRAAPAKAPEATARRMPPPESYALLLARLAEGGVRRGPAETAREHAERALRFGAAPAESVARVVGAFEAERWGGRPPDPAVREALLALAGGVAVPRPSVPRAPGA